MMKSVPSIYFLRVASIPTPLPEPALAEVPDKGLHLSYMLESVLRRAG